MGTAATVGAGEALLPTAGIGGLAARVALWLAMPLVLAACGFLTPAERASLRSTLRPAAVRARLRALAAERPPGDLAARTAPTEPEGGTEAGGYAPEVYEAVRRDEDRL